MKISDQPVMGMNLVLLNRESAALPDDGWIMVAKRGEHPIAATLEDGSRVVMLQVLDDDALTKMANRFAADKAEDETLELLVDFDHFSEDVDKPSEAAGWIQTLENRADGLYAKIRWSDSGKAAVEGLRYRYISPVWAVADCEHLGNRRVRPTRLDKAAVTNSPNIKGLKPLKNRENNAPNGQEENTMDYKALLLGLLGLAPEATDEDISTAAEGIKGKLENADTAATELDAMKKKELEGQVSADMEEFKDVIKEEDKEKVKDQLMKNREGTRMLLGSIVKPAAAQKLLNRKDAKSPELGKAEGAEKIEKQQKYVDEIKLKNRCSNSEAWAQAATLKPELFK